MQKTLKHLLENILPSSVDKELAQGNAVNLRAKMYQKSIESITKRKWKGDKY